MYIFPSKDIYQNLSHIKCIDLMKECFEDLANNLVGMSPKYVQGLPDNKSLLGVMTGYQKEGTFSIMKSIGLFPKIKNKNSHQGVISLYDSKRGELLAIFDAASITALRTASLSALATNYLAHTDASTLSLIGSGEQSYHHAIAISKVRNIKKINIFNRTVANSIKLKHRLKEHGFSVPIHTYPLSKLGAISRDFDIITLATSSPTPLLELKDLPQSCHINSIGACTPKVSEVDPAIIDRAYLVVDDMTIAKKEAGNLINSNANVFSKNITELKEVIKENPTSTDKITLFNSTGLGAQDLACAIYLYKTHKGIASANINLGG